MNRLHHAGLFTILACILFSALPTHGGWAVGIEAAQNSPGVLSLKPAAAAGDWIEIDVTEYINQQLAANKIASFVLADMYQTGKNVTFFSAEALAADRPFIEIDGSIVPVTEDSYVYAADAANNFGADTELMLYESWGHDCDTHTPGMEIDIHEALGIWGPHRTQHAWQGFQHLLSWEIAPIHYQLQSI